MIKMFPIFKRRRLEPISIDIGSRFFADIIGQPFSITCLRPLLDDRSVVALLATESETYKSFCKTPIAYKRIFVSWNRQRCGPFKFERVYIRRGDINLKTVSPDVKHIQFYHGDNVVDTTWLQTLPSSMKKITVESFRMPTITQLPRSITSIEFHPNTPGSHILVECLRHMERHPCYTESIITYELRRPRCREKVRRIWKGAPEREMFIFNYIREKTRLYDVSISISKEGIVRFSCLFSTTFIGPLTHSHFGPFESDPECSQSGPTVTDPSYSYGEDQYTFVFRDSQSTCRRQVCHSGREWFDDYTRQELL